MTPDHEEGSIGTSRSLERIEREKALRTIREAVNGSMVFGIDRAHRALDTLEADLEAAERERDRLKEYEDQWNELASVEFIDYWHTIGYPCTAGTAIKAALRDLATAREALEHISRWPAAGAAQKTARAALRSLGDVD